MKIKSGNVRKHFGSEEKTILIFKKTVNYFTKIKIEQYKPRKDFEQFILKNRKGTVDTTGTTETGNAYLRREGCLI